MAKGYRYSLVYEEFEGEKVYFEKSTRRKFPLTQIDAFTTRHDKEQLKAMFDYLSGRKLDDGEFFVEYIQEGQKRLRVVYSDSKNLCFLSNDNVGRTYVEDSVKFETYVVNFLYSLIADRKLFDYLKKNKYLNQYVVDKIYNYMFAKQNGNDETIDYTFKKVKEVVANYKIIRNIEDGIFKYRKEYENSINMDIDVRNNQRYR